MRVKDIDIYAKQSYEDPDNLEFVDLFHGEISLKSEVNTDNVNISVDLLHYYNRVSENTVEIETRPISLGKKQNQVWEYPLNKKGIHIAPLKGFEIDFDQIKKISHQNADMFLKNRKNILSSYCLSSSLFSGSLKKYAFKKIFEDHRLVVDAPIWFVTFVDMDTGYTLSSIYSAMTGALLCTSTFAGISIAASFTGWDFLAWLAMIIKLVACIAMGILTGSAFAALPASAGLSALIGIPSFWATLAIFASLLAEIVARWGTGPKIRALQEKVDELLEDEEASPADVQELEDAIDDAKGEIESNPDIPDEVKDGFKGISPGQ